MTTYQGTSGTDVLVGADDVADTFVFESGEWSAADSVDGGASATFPNEVDTLWLTDGVYLGSDLANVTGIESISLYGNGQLVVGTDLLDQVTSGALLFVTAAIGAQTIDASQAGIPADGFASEVIFNIFYDNDHLVGSEHGDWVTTRYGGNPTLDLLGGDDSVFLGGGGTPVVLGGAGHDRLYLDDMSHAITLDLEATLKLGQDSTALQVLTLSDVEEFQGSREADLMQGDRNANVFDGSDGDDELWGRGGDDVLVGGIGNDVLHGGGGRDELFGLDGSDTADYGEVAARVDVDLNRAVDQAVIGTANVDQLDGIENVTGGSRADLLRGDGGANILDGGIGDDVLHGRGGDDTLLGGTEDDRLRGGQGSNLLDGGGGIDTVDYDWLGSGGGLYVDLLAGFSTGLGLGDGLIGIENAAGSVDGDTMVARLGGSMLQGRDGADHLYGWSGQDDLRGGSRRGSARRQRRQRPPPRRRRRRHLRLQPRRRRDRRRARHPAGHRHDRGLGGWAGPDRARGPLCRLPAIHRRRRGDPASCHRYRRLCRRHLRHWRGGADRFQRLRPDLKPTPAASRPAMSQPGPKRRPAYPSIAPVACGAGGATRHFPDQGGRPHHARLRQPAPLPEDRRRRLSLDGMGYGNPGPGCARAGPGGRARGLPAG